MMLIDHPSLRLNKHPTEDDPIPIKKGSKTCNKKCASSSPFITWDPLLLVQIGSCFLCYIFDPLFFQPERRRRNNQHDSEDGYHPRYPKLSIHELMFGFVLMNFLIMHPIPTNLMQSKLHYQFP